MGIASMPKALCIFGVIASALVLLVFGVDLATKLTFGGASRVMDVAFILFAALLGYLSWQTMREQT